MIARANSRALCGYRAFTIVELLVAMSVTALLAGVLISIVSSMTTAAHRASGSLLSSNQAKVALDFLAQDLESAVMRADGHVWLAATIQPDQSDKGDSGCDWAEWPSSPSTNGKPGALGGSLELSPNGVTGTTSEQQPFAEFRFGMAGVWLRLFTIEPDDNTSKDDLSAVRAASYQMIRAALNNSGTQRYALFRSSVEAGNTFQTGYNLFASPYNEGVGTEGVSGNVRRPPSSRLLANNVIDFGVRLWVRDAGGVLRVPFPLETKLGFAARVPPTDGTDPNAVPPNPSPGAPAYGEMNYGFPEVAEVFLRVLTDEGAKQIEALETGRISGDWWQIAEANSQVYTRRVEIKGRPL